MRKKKKAEPSKLPPMPFVRGVCLICNGDGETCSSCGEAETVCRCDHYLPQPCPECERNKESKT